MRTPYRYMGRAERVLEAGAAPPTDGAAQGGVADDLSLSTASSTARLVAAARANAASSRRALVTNALQLLTSDQNVQVPLHQMPALLVCHPFVPLLPFQACGVLLAMRTGWLNLRCYQHERLPLRRRRCRWGNCLAEFNRNVLMAA